MTKIGRAPSPTRRERLRKKREQRAAVNGQTGPSQVIAPPSDPSCDDSGVKHTEKQDTSSEMSQVTMTVDGKATMSTDTQTKDKSASAKSTAAKSSKGKSTKPASGGIDLMSPNNTELYASLQDTSTSDDMNELDAELEKLELQQMETLVLGAMITRKKFRMYAALDETELKFVEQAIKDKETGLAMARLHQQKTKFDVEQDRKARKVSTHTEIALDKAKLKESEKEVKDTEKSLSGLRLMQQKMKYDVAKSRKTRAALSHMDQGLESLEKDFRMSCDNAAKGLPVKQIHVPMFHMGDLL